MKRGLYSPFALGLAVAATASWGLASVAPPKSSFAPYQVIIDRAIFGKPPPAKAAPASAPLADTAQKQAEALAKKITLCAVNRTPADNTAVGLIDNDAKPPRNLYLNVGDTVDGYTILAADCDAETATIEKDGVVISLRLGKGLVVTAASAPAAPALAAATASASDPIPASPTAPQPPPEPVLKTATEQLISMAVGGSPGVEVPPLPVSADDDLGEDAATAMKATIVIPEHASDDDANHLANVGWAKVDMQAHIKEGGTAVSYIKQLEERRNEEARRQQAARAEAEARIVELAKKLSEQELQKQRKALNQWLVDNEVEPLEDPAEEEE
ncbi:MAG: hypothetical protein FJ222_08035 [Lentisphaerae bacterium]|nr:hypothetical protein [Lentisphaerota bacterium]